MLENNAQSRGNPAPQSYVELLSLTECPVVALIAHGTR